MLRISLSSLVVLFLLVSAHAQKAESVKDHFDKAAAYLREQKYDLALSELDLVIQMNARYAPAYGLRGNLRLIRQEFDLALADYNKIIELAPNIPGIHQIYNNRGVILALKGDGAGAIKDFDKAIAISPGYAEAYSSRGFKNRRPAISTEHSLISTNRFRSIPESPIPTKVGALFDHMEAI